MCGIVGLFCKSPELEPRLGELPLGDARADGRPGPDSAGVAVYRDPAPDGWTKLTLYSADPAFDWERRRAARCSTCERAPRGRARRGATPTSRGVVRAARPELRVMSAGRVIEIYKEVGLPRDFVDALPARRLRRARTASATRGWRPRAASRPRARTRSRPATTSASSTTARSRTTTGCASELRREGLAFQTENDTEVAAGYLTWRLREGDTLAGRRSRAASTTLDGFYTFLVGTADGFAVLRDPIACKPAVLAETDDWVAMASEYRAIAVLPGAADARIWEPEPSVVYAWEKELVVT